MTAFILCAMLMLLAALAFVLAPLLRRSTKALPQADRLRALDAALASGVLDDDEYARKRASLLAATDTYSANTPPASPAAIVLLAFFVPAAALGLYRFVGTPQAIDAPPAIAASGTEHANAADMQQAIAALAARLQQQPDDAEGWALLGRAYTAVGEPDKALDALRHAHQLAATNTALSVEYAQALALNAPDHRIAGESRDLLESVIRAEPDNQRALWLLGISDYQSAHYDAAIARWNTLLPLVAGNAEVAASVRKQIAQAQALRDGKAPPDATEATEATADTPHAAAPGPAADAPRLTVTVNVTPALASQVDPAATLFVFARAASGPPMPLAIQKLSARQLPLTLTLDESMGMLPNLKLSMFPQIVVGARISKSGMATPSSGDLQALSPPLDVHHKEPITLTIEQRVP